MLLRSAITLALGLGLAAPAFAGIYGSVDAGMVDVHASLPYADNTGGLVSTGYGDGQTYGLTLGMQTASPLFVEVGYNQAITNDRANTTTPGCDVNPLLGIINDCWRSGTVDLELDQENVEVLAGYQLKTGGLNVSPYAGLRQQTIMDSRNISYYYAGGSSNYIIQTHEFDGLGVFAGVRLRQDMGSAFWGADARVGWMDGDRTMSIDDKEISTPGGSQTDRQRSSVSDGLDSTQYGIKLYAGMTFDVAGQKASASLGYAYEEAVNVLNTANTNNDVYPVGTIGNSSADLRTDTVYLSLGVALK